MSDTESTTELIFIHDKGAVYVPSDELAKVLDMPHEMLVTQIEQVISKTMNDDEYKETFKKCLRKDDFNHDDENYLYMITRKGFELLWIPAFHAHIIVEYLKGFQKYEETYANKE